MRRLVMSIVIGALVVGVFHRPMRGFTDTLHFGLLQAFADPFRSTLWLVHIDIPNYYGCEWRNDSGRVVPPERMLEYTRYNDNLHPSYSLAEVWVWIFGLAVCVALWVVIAMLFWVMCAALYVWHSLNCGLGEAFRAAWVEFRKALRNG